MLLKLLDHVARPASDVKLRSYVEEIDRERIRRLQDLEAFDDRTTLGVQSAKPDSVVAGAHGEVGEILDECFELIEDLDKRVGRSRTRPGRASPGAGRNRPACIVAPTADGWPRLFAMSCRVRDRRRSACRARPSSRLSAPVPFATPSMATKPDRGQSTSGIVGASSPASLATTARHMFVSFQRHRRNTTGAACLASGSVACGSGSL